MLLNQFFELHRLSDYAVSSIILAPDAPKRRAWRGRAITAGVLPSSVWGEAEAPAARWAPRPTATDHAKTVKRKLRFLSLADAPLSRFPAALLPDRLPIHPRQRLQHVSVPPLRPGWYESHAAQPTSLERLPREALVFRLDKKRLPENAEMDRPRASPIRALHNSGARPKVAAAIGLQTYSSDESRRGSRPKLYLCLSHLL